MKLKIKEEPKDKNRKKTITESHTNKVEKITQEFVIKHLAAFKRLAK